MFNRRELIIWSAIVRIAEQGDSFSTEQVAEDADCSQSPVFRYFGSRDGLMERFVSVCRYILDSLRSVPIPADLTKGPLDR